MKQFLSVADAGDPSALAHLARQLKAAPWVHASLGQRKTLGLLFLNPSLRTRMSTQKAARHLGMDVMVMNMDQEGWRLETQDGAVMDGDKAEHIADAAAVIAQYCDIVGIRAFPGLQDRAADYAETFIRQFQRYSSVPVLSLESATRHPLQSLADLVTVQEHWHAPQAPKVVLAWAPHPRALPQAVANSFAEWMLAAGYPLTIAHPQGYALDPQFTTGAQITHHLREAVADADFVYIKSWSAWEPYGQVLCRDTGWMLTEAHLPKASTRIMHCLPVRRGVELSHELLEGPHALVQAQAGNRVWAAQAILVRLLEGLTNESTSPSVYSAKL
ncbi:MAG: acetylornithine carbamoyltransferase [Bacteroidetes bacterium]|nr:acetylornithine carbamoyltransferase [Bacteroidota bacterium]